MLELIWIVIKRTICRLIYINHNYIKVDKHRNGYTKVCKLCGKREDIFFNDGFTFYN